MVCNKPTAGVNRCHASFNVIGSSKIVFEFRSCKGVLFRGRIIRDLIQAACTQLVACDLGLSILDSLRTVIMKPDIGRAHRASS